MVVANDSYMRRFSLRNKVYLGFVLAAALLAATGYFYNRSTSSYVRTVLEVQETQRAVNQMETVLSLAKDTETGERGYVITRQERFLEPYNAALGSLQQELADLETLTKSDPFHASRLPQLRRLIRDETAFLNRTIRLVRQNELEAASQLVAGGEGKRILDAIRRLVGQMQAYERKELTRLLSQVETEARLNNRVNLIGLAVLITLFAVAAYTIVRDMTRQQHLERELLQKNDALATLSAQQRALLDQLYEAQEIAQVGSFDLNAVTGTFTGTPQLYHIYGWDPTQAGKSSEADLVGEALHPDDLANVQQAVALSLQKLEPYEAQYRIRLPDGTQKYLLARGKPTRVGSALHLQGTVMDVTQRQHYEQQLQALNQSLQATNDELSAALEELSVASRRIQQYSTELEQKNQDLEAFSYSVSHDLKTPLRSVLSFGGILEEEYAIVLDEEGRRLLGIILTSARSMHELIDALLQFSRLGRTAVHKEAVDLDKLVRGVVIEMEANGLAVGPVTIGALGTARADRRLIRQVWYNLLSNAVKFSAGTPGAHITADCQRQGAENVYCVADNGVGFAPQYAGDLFGVFKRLPSAEGFPGTGVGLAICQRIVTNHGGRIWAEGAENQGAQFYFTLPTENS